MHASKIFLAVIGTGLMSVSSAITLANNKPGTDVVTLQNAAEKVKVELYFEALCPFCHMVSCIFF